VPGLIAATPFAAVALAWGWDHARSRFVLLVAVVPIALVVAFQFTGGAAPQWAGRYLLLSGFLAAVVGIAERERMARWAQLGFVGASVAVTVFGLVWLSQRSHDVADAADRLEARSEDVLLSPNGFVSREFGATYGRHRWLASGSPEDFDLAVDVITQSGADDFALVRLSTDQAAPEIDGWVATGTETVPFIASSTFEVTTYERAP
jgi:hypothetical protein